MLSFLRKITPKCILSSYHFLMAHLASMYFRYPSSRMIVIGVTGTNGKSTTCKLLASILQQAGFRVGMSSTTEFQIHERMWLNPTKMTMVGRWDLQKLLSDMVRAQCLYSIIETTSEGIKQFRHAGINYDVLVFTNLTPEHIESHGSFEKYKQAKGKLFTHLSRCKPKHWEDIRARVSVEQQARLTQTGVIPKLAIINMDSEHASYFLSCIRETSIKRIGFTTKENLQGQKPEQIVRGMIERSDHAWQLTLNHTTMHPKLMGDYNMENALAAAVTAQALGISLDEITTGIESVTTVPGRLEFLPNNRGITIIVDQAPEPESLKNVYRVIENFPHQRIIHVLGSAGGGRDAARRPILGQSAGSHADVVIVTNEDPYDEDPLDIIEQVAEGARKAGKQDKNNLFLILDRREAIQYALDCAKPQDMVLVTGKGAEQAIVGKNRQKIPWDDRQVIREILNREPSKRENS